MRDQPTSTSTLTISGTSAIRFTVTKVSRGQPRTWTFIEFEVADEDTAQLADVPEEALQPTGPSVSL